MKLSIRTKLFLALFLFNLLLVSIFAYSIYKNSRDSFLQREIDSKMASLKIIASLVDNEKIKTWKDYKDTFREDYKFTQKLLQSFWEQDKFLTYVYIICFDHKSNKAFYKIANSLDYDVLWIEFEKFAFWIAHDKNGNLFIRQNEENYYTDFTAKIDDKKIPVKFLRKDNSLEVFIGNDLLLSLKDIKKLEVKIHNKTFSKETKASILEKFNIAEKEYEASVSFSPANETIAYPDTEYFTSNLQKEILKNIYKSKEAYYEESFTPTNFGNFLSIYVPILGPTKTVSGILLYVMSDIKIKEFENKIIKNISNLFTFSIFLIVFLSYFIAKRITTPIYELLTGVEKIKSLDFHYEIKMKLKDEFGVLTKAFNEMSKSIYKNTIEQQNYTDNLEVKVAERTKELELAKSNAEKSSKVKASFLALINHELRTPLNGVLGMSRLLENTNITKEQKEYISNIEASGLLLLTLIDNILEITQIESGKIEIIENNFNFKNSLEKNIEKYKSALNEKNLSFSLILKNEFSKMTFGPEKRYFQIFNHIISNAIKFTNKGSIEVEISTENISDSKFFLITRITDTGIGIEEGVIEHVFQEFSQGETDLNRKYGGSGLGLYITKKVLEKIEGNLEFHSKPNIGSTFIFKILFQETTEIEKIVENREAKTYISDEIPLRILVAEDNPINQMLIQKILKNLGYVSSLAKDGLEAVKKTREEKFDLIFMDIQMPNMDGIEATKIILSESEKKPYIIALTANVLEDDKKIYIRTGFKAHIGKPYSINLIKEEILKLKYLGAA